MSSEKMNEVWASPIDAEGTPADLEEVSVSLSGLKIM